MMLFNILITPTLLTLTLLTLIQIPLTLLTLIQIPLTPTQITPITPTILTLIQEKLGKKGRIHEFVFLKLMTTVLATMEYF